MGEKVRMSIYAIDDHALTQARLMELLHYFPSTGLFAWREQRAGVKAGQRVGTFSGGYIRVSVDGKRHMAHRLAWLYMTGEWPSQHIDHINRDRSDNRWANLRCLPQEINGQNQGGKGYHYSPKLGKYIAQISTGGRSAKKVIYLGLFESEQAARHAYLEAKKQHHPVYSA